MLNTCVPRRMPLGLRGEEREVRERVVHRRVGRDRRMVLTRIRRARHRAREHEVLGQPDRLVAEAFGRERGVEVEVRVERAERDAELHGAPSTASPAVVYPPASAATPSARREVAAVDVDRRAGDEPRPVRREVDGRGRDVVDIARERERGLHRYVTDAGRGDDVGGDAVHPHLPIAELERERLREVRDRGLHRRVDGEAGCGAVRLDRGDVDDRPARAASSACTPG